MKTWMVAETEDFVDSICSCLVDFQSQAMIIYQFRSNFGKIHFVDLDSQITRPQETPKFSQILDKISNCGQKTFNLQLVMVAGLLPTLYCIISYERLAWEKDFF